MDKRVCSNCRCSPAGFDSDLCWPCEKKLYDSDEHEPDRYPQDDPDWTNDDRYNDPRTGQAEQLNKER